jgi:hypothetical protein
MSVAFGSFSLFICELNLILKDHQHHPPGAAEMDSKEEEEEDVDLEMEVAASEDEEGEGLGMDNDHNK